MCLSRSLWLLISTSLSLLIYSSYPVASSECGSQKPLVCTVGASNEEQLRDSYHTVIATSNLTVYTGQTAVFTYQINTTLNGLLTPVAFVNNCADDVHCVLVTPTQRTCTFTDVSSSDNGKEIHFYVLALPAQLCHNPPSYLTVLGPPSSIGITYSIDPSSGLHVYLISPLPPHTNATISLHTADTSSSPLSIVLLSNGHNITLFPPLLLSNHTGIYTVTSIPSNPAGNGPSSTVTVDLYNEGQYSLYYEIDAAMISLNTDSEFIGAINIKVNANQLITVPNTLSVSSECSSETTSHSVNMTHLLIDPIVTLSVPLVSGIHNCSFRVTDERGNTQKIDTGQSTFHTQSYHRVWTARNTINVSCSFIEGSSVQGCLIVAKDIHNETNTGKVLYTQSSNAVQLLLPIAGVYNISVYDYFINTGYDDSNPVYTEQLIVEPPRITISPSITTAIPSATHNCANGEECNDSPSFHLSATENIIVAIVVVFVAVSSVAVVILVGYVAWNKRHQRRLVINHGVPPSSPPPSPSIQPRLTITPQVSSQQSQSSLSHVDPYNVDPIEPTDTIIKEDLAARQQMATMEEDKFKIGDLAVTSSVHNPRNLQSSVDKDVKGTTISMVTGLSHEQMKTDNFTKTTTFDDSADQLLPEEETVKFSIEASPQPSPIKKEPQDGNYFFRQNSANTIASGDEDQPQAPPTKQRRSSQVLVMTRGKNIQRHTRTQSLVPLSNNVFAFPESVSRNSSLSLTQRQGSNTTLKNENGGELLVTPSAVSLSHHQPLDQVHEDYATGSHQSRLNELSNPLSSALVASNDKNGADKKTTTCSDSTKISETEELLTSPNRTAKVKNKTSKKKH